MDGHTRKVRLISTTTDMLNSLGDAIHLFGRCYQENTKVSLTHPTRPKSSYLFFCDQARGKLMKENPDLTSNEIAKLMGLQWRAISNKEKEHFHGLYLIEKKRYEDELVVYEQFMGSTTNKRKSVSLDPAKPLPKAHVPEAENLARVDEETEEDEINEETEEEEEEEEDEIEDSDDCSEPNDSNNVAEANQRSPGADRDWPVQESDDDEDSKYSDECLPNSRAKDPCEFSSRSSSNSPVAESSLALGSAGLVSSRATQDILRLEGSDDEMLNTKQENYYTTLSQCAIKAGSKVE